MKTIALIAISLFLVSCDKFNKGHLLTGSFDADLPAISSGKKTRYSDGLFLVYNVTDHDPLYSRFFTKPFNEGNVTVSFGNTEFNSSDVGSIRYRVLDSFDGYTKTIFYIPKQKILGFGYSDGLL